MSNYSKCDECLPGLVTEPDGCYPPDKILIVDENCTEGESHCGYTVRKEKNVTVLIQVSNFSNIRGKDDGGAFYIINSAVNCTETLFINITSEGGGGAIFVKNWKYLVNNVYFEKLTFVMCKALYGGAIYAYSASDQNLVSVRECKFYSNEVDPKGGNSSDGRLKLVGGNALFISAKNANIKKCVFENNKGTGAAVKIFNKFESEESLEDSIVIVKRGNKEGSKILLSDCKMKISRNEKNSIYVEGDDMNKLEIRDCKFTGKLPKGAKYIGGKIHARNIPKIQVNNCDFEVKGKSTMSFEIIDDDLF